MIINNFLIWQIIKRDKEEGREEREDKWHNLSELSDQIIKCKVHNCKRTPLSKNK